MFVIKTLPPSKTIKFGKYGIRDILYFYIYIAKYLLKVYPKFVPENYNTSVILITVLTKYMLK